MNYYQHHIGDFIRDTSRLTDSQCVAYLRMIWIYYETEQPLESDADAVAFKIGANASDVHQIFKHFFFLHDGLWHQSRCDAEILAFRAKSDKAKKSADARWKNAKLMRTHSERNADEQFSDANQKPVTSNQEKTEKKKQRDSASGSRLTADWQCPDGWIDDAIQIRPAWTRDHVASVADGFRDYWVGVAGAKGRKLDWRATWRNWVRTHRDTVGTAGSPRSQFMSHSDQSKLAAARAIFGTEIEGNYGNGNIIDVSPATRSVGSKDISGTSGQLRFSVSEPVEDGPDT